MKAKHQWVRWRLEMRNGKQTKVPYRVDGKPAASDNPNDWTDYRTAVTGATINREQGVGFMFADGFAGIDLDGCRNSETGDITVWADDIVQSLDAAYVEISPSGTGLHIFVMGKVPGTDKKFNLNPAIGNGKAGIEIYDARRYFTVTGDAYFDEAGNACACDLSEVYKKFHELRRDNPAPRNERAESADVGEPTKATWHGTFRCSKYDIFKRGEILSPSHPFRISNGVGQLEYETQSEADLGFCTVLAMMHGDDAEQIWDEYTESSLVREKWLNRKDDFIRLTVGKAIESAEKKAKTGDQMSLPSTASITQAVSPAPLVEDAIPDFDDSSITGIYRDIVDAACSGTTIPRQYAFLAAKVYIGALIAGKVSFEGMEDTSSYYGVVVGESGTGKGLSWKRVVDDILTTGENLLPSVKILEGSGDSGAGLKDFFFDSPKDAPVICMIDEAVSLGHKAGEKKNPEIVDTIVELATKHKFTRAKAARSNKAKAGRSHDNAHLSLYMCAQNRDVIAAAFPNRRGLGLFERFYPEFSHFVKAGKLPKVDRALSIEIWGKVQKLQKSGEIKMAPGVEERIESYWGGLSNEVQSRVRLKAHLIRDMFMAAHGRGSQVAEMEDLEVALKLFPRQLKLRDRFFTTEIPDKVGLYLARLKAITEGMRRRLRAGESMNQVAMSLRDFQTDTHAFRDNEMHVFQTAWRNWDAQMATTEVTGKNGQKYKKFIPEPNEDEMWT
jgi:hypothetical protein